MLYHCHRRSKINYLTNGRSVSQQKLNFHHSPQPIATSPRINVCDPIASEHADKSTNIKDYYVTSKKFVVKGQEVDIFYPWKVAKDEKNLPQILRGKNVSQDSWVSFEDLGALYFGYDMDKKIHIVEVTEDGVAQHWDTPDFALYKAAHEAEEDDDDQTQYTKMRCMEHYQMQGYYPNSVSSEKEKWIDTSSKDYYNS